MPDPIPSSTDRTVFVQRHGALPYISLAFNALILLLLLFAIVCHHHQRPPSRDGDGDGRRAAFEREDRFDHRDFGGRQGAWARHDFADRDDGGFGGGRHAWKHDEGADRDGRGFADAGPGDVCPGGFGPGRDHDQGWGAADHQPSSPEAMTDRFMLALDGKLALTDQESSQIRPIIQQGVTQFQKDMEAQKDAHQKMIDDAKAKIRAVLTPDQQKQFDAMTAGPGAPPAPGK